jgi:hypothetical protein
MTTPFWTPPLSSTEDPVDSTLIGTSQFIAPQTTPAPIAPDNYLLLEILGRGGMGVVWKANQRSLHRTVALKMMTGDVTDPVETSRFLAEAEAIATVQHPGIVAVYDFGTSQGKPFLAMEYCSAGNLASRLDGTPMNPQKAATLLESLARATQAAHAAGIIHRDLKPGNILFASDETPKISDFGLAKRMSNDNNLTAPGTVVGTPSYMAPEQAHCDKDIGPAADIWSLGAILYECLTGRPPFRGATVLDTLQLVIHNDPVGVRSLTPSVPRDLENICLKCLEKHPHARYHTAEDLANDLRKFLEGRPVSARPIGPVIRLAKWMYRRPVLASLIATLILSLLVGTGVSLHFALWAREETAVARQSEDEAKEALGLAKRTMTILSIGLLRPLGSGEQRLGLDALEVGALEDLASLPAEFDQVREDFLQHALHDRQSANRLAWRLEPVLRASLGLSPQRWSYFSDKVRELLHDPTTAPQQRRLCARIAVRIGLNSVSAQKTAAPLLVESTTTELPVIMRNQINDELTRLADRINPQSAPVLMDSILHQIDKVHPDSLVAVSRAFVLAANTLEPQRRELDRFAMALADRIERLMLASNPQQGVAIAAMRAFLLVGEHLPKQRAEQLLQVTKRQAVLIPDAVHRGVAIEVFAVVSPKVPTEVCRQFALELAQSAIEHGIPKADRLALLIAKNVQGRLMASLSEAELRKLLTVLPATLAKTETPEGLTLLARISNRWPLHNREDTAFLAKMIAERLREFIQKTKPDDIAALVEALEELANLLPKEQTQELARVLSAALFAPGGKADATTAMHQLLPRLSELEISRLYQQHAVSITEQTSPEDLRRLAGLLGVLSDKAGDLIAKNVAQRLSSPSKTKETHLSAESLKYLAEALRRSGDLSNAQVRKTADELRKHLSAETKKQPTAGELLQWCKALEALGPLLGTQIRRETADELIQGLIQKVNRGLTLEELRDLAFGFWAVESFGTEVSQARAEFFARIVVRQTAMAGWTEDRDGLLALATARLTVQGLLELFKEATCIGPARSQVLDRLGTALGQRFRDPKELIDWVSTNRPDLNLCDPPKPWTED